MELSTSEVDLGLDWYVSDTPGVGGVLKREPRDFRVDEISDFSYADEGKHAVVRATLTDHETHEFARDLSNALGASRKRVSWAGTKDKRAVTSQLFTVAGVSEEEIEGVDIDGAEIEFVGRSHHPIRLGDLRANEFEVVLRSVEDTDGIDEVTDEIDEFGGVPNLFGSQRFGSRRPITHRVGEAVLADDYERAVREYLVTSFPDEPRGTREARRRLDDGWGDEEEYADALSYYPEHLGYERALLNSLVENADGEAGDDTTDDYREALDALPRNLKRLFVNAAQSRLFNLVLRARYDEGMEFDRSYPGDVVCFVDDAGYPETDELQEVTESNAESVNRHVARGRAYVTAPLLGSESEFSGGRQGEIERGVLSRAAFELDDFDRDDEYAAEGTRRPVLVRPDIEHETDGDDTRFEFTLPKGSYATVVLREYLKDDHVA